MEDVKKDEAILYIAGYELHVQGFSDPAPFFRTFTVQWTMKDETFALDFAWNGTRFVEQACRYVGESYAKLQAMEVRAAIDEFYPELNAKMASESPFKQDVKFYPEHGNCDIIEHGEEQYEEQYTLWHSKQGVIFAISLTWVQYGYRYSFTFAFNSGVWYPLSSRFKAINVQDHTPRIRITKEDLMIEAYARVERILSETENRE